MRIPVSASLALVLGLASSPCWAGSLKGKVTAVGGRAAADAVVYLGATPGSPVAPPASHPRVDQKDMTFVPRVTVVLVGTTVDFVNSDPVLHNVFTPDKCAEKFNLGSWPQGQARSYTFKQPCVATLLCSVHPEMEAFVVAVPTPHFAVADKGGAYLIEGIPNGAYEVKVWHPKLKAASRQVTVSGDTVVDFELQR